MTTPPRPVLYAHQVSRNNYYEIAHELANSVSTFLAAEVSRTRPGKKSKDPSKGDALEAARKNGYKIINNKADFQKLTPADGKVIVINEWLQIAAPCLT